MEKNNWKDARKYLLKAMEMTNASNHEILRCYGLCEYWYGNREKGLSFLKDAFVIDNKDAEVVYNLIQLYILEQEYKKAQEMISYFNKNKNSLKFVDKELDFYQTKISLFEKFIKAKKLFQIRK
jgi:tetratricopeptide (TPR) repeat protein